MACVCARGCGSLLLADCSRLRRPRQQEGTLFPPPPSLSFSSSSSLPSSRSRTTRARISRMASHHPTLKAEAAVTIEKSGVKIVRNPPESKLSELGVRSWPKWGCPPSKFPWTYSPKETCYLLEGKVKVYPDGSDEPVEIAAGDLVEFPKGMSCTWDVSVGVDKHYRFD